ncbi:unnamed protein product, partial [Brachionus calyciflorus]
MSNLEKIESSSHKKKTYQEDNEQSLYPKSKLELASEDCLISAYKKLFEKKQKVAKSCLPEEGRKLLLFAIDFVLGLDENGDGKKGIV